jgi:Integrase core domain
VDRGWIARPHAGWRVAARRAVLLAFLDDHSRLLVGWRWGTGEDVFRLEAALRAGLMARGVPDAILVDRGSAFVSSQLLRACAVLGVKLIHASPRAATTKGKVERFFRTVRDQFLVEIDDGVELGELNRLFSAWLEVVYHRRVHSETGQTPLARFDAAGAPAPADPGAAARGVLVEPGADRDENRDGVAARQHLRGRRRARCPGIRRRDDRASETSRRDDDVTRERHGRHAPTRRRVPIRGFPPNGGRSRASAARPVDHRLRHAVGDLRFVPSPRQCPSR